MSDVPALEQGETIAVTLVPAPEYTRNRNRVVALTDRRLVRLQRRTLGWSYDVAYVPLGEVLEVSHRRTFALGGFVSGAVLLLASVGLAVVYAQDDVGLGTILLELVLGGHGALLVFRARRHALTFRCSTGEYRWLSASRNRAGAWIAAEVREFFARRGVPLRGFENLPVVATTPHASASDDGDDVPDRSPYCYPVPYQADVQAALDALHRRLLDAKEAEPSPMLGIRRVATVPARSCTAPLSREETLRCFGTETPGEDAFLDSREFWRGLEPGKARHVTVFTDGVATDLVFVLRARD